MTAPKISVLIPSYNRGAFIPKVLESVFGQTVSPSEVILVDDGSTDETPQIVHRLLQEHPDWRGRFKFLQQPNQGKSVALNLGLENIDEKAEWIAFNDSDDCWHPEKLELQLSALAAHPDCGVCFTDASYVNNPAKHGTSLQAAGCLLSGNTGRLDSALQVTAAMSHGIMMQTVVVASANMRAFGNFDPVLRVAQDADLMFRLALNTSFCFVNQPLVEIDRTPQRQEGLTTKVPLQSLARLRLHEGMLLKWLGLVGKQNTEVRSIIEKRLEGTRSALANQLVARGAWPEARAVLCRALRCRWSSKLVVKFVFALLRLPYGAK